MNEERGPIIHVEITDITKKRITKYLSSNKTQYKTISELVRSAVTHELDKIGA